MAKEGYTVPSAADSGGVAGLQHLVKHRTA